MIKQIDSNNSLNEKKYKILSYSVLLGNTSDIEKDKAELEKTARYLDGINEASYEEILASKEYTTTTIEEEKSRLEDIIDFISDRIRERDRFNDSYFKVMHSYIDDLPDIKDNDSLDYYKDRLKNISEYLANSEEISLSSEQLTNLRQELRTKQDNEENSKNVNKKMESLLLEEFTKVICDNEYYTKLNYVDIDGELVTLENEIIEKKSTLDTFVSSFEVLEQSGISGGERDEYNSYVSDVKNDYYVSAEKKYMLNLYKLVLNLDNDYDGICAKREKIVEILEDRDDLRSRLDIANEDPLIDFIHLNNEQYAVIKSQKYVIEDINRLKLEISKLENKLDTLKTRNQRKEILDILAEFKVSDGDNETLEKEINDEVKAPNVVVNVSSPDKIDLKEALDIANVVMKKVVLATQPKKFTRKKTAKELQEVNTEKEEKVIDGNANVSIDLNIDVSVEPEKKEEEKDTFVTEDNPFVEKNEGQIFEDMDPFLDDNNLEENVETLSNMPIVDNIGSVKPTTKLSKIEKLNDDNMDVVLPTMGLTDNADNEVSIKSSDYVENGQ